MRGLGYSFTIDVSNKLSESKTGLLYLSWLNKPALLVRGGGAGGHPPLASPLQFSLLKPFLNIFQHHDPSFPLHLSRVSQSSFSGVYSHQMGVFLF